MKMGLTIPRRMMQIVAMVFFLMPLWWGTTMWFGTYLSSQVFNIVLSDPLSALEVMLAGKMIWQPLVWSIVPLVLIALLLGRVFCGWICPLNTLIEFVAILEKSLLHGKLSSLSKSPSHTDQNNYQPYWMLLFFLSASMLLSLPIFTIVSPIGILMRALLFGMGLDLIVVLMILVAEWYYGSKTWCRYFCPVGAFYGMVGRWRPLKIVIDDQRCTNCGKCQAACTMKVTVGSALPLDIMNCTNCGDCIDSCGEDAVGFRFNVKKGGG